ncbi:MAG TPA: vitamin B12 dependent-methionine synthase activation domain-containing protein, partial [Blastocatellia bacterium]|nr:vitamin B12 dependent-methionine synthase activation domain-containing protein [Blastocatellia bacterium]
DIIMSNNGYEVVNLGIKVPPEVLIQAVREHKPDAIGLSGLLVKSAQQMVLTAEDLKDSGIHLPLLVGGAALSDRFTRGKIAPAYGNTVVYANDAMNGLDILNRLMDPESRARLESDLLERDLGVVARIAEPVVAETEQRSSKISLDVRMPPAPDLDRHVEEVRDLDEVWSYVNPQMLYGRHLGLRGRFTELLASGDRLARELEETIDRVKEECRAGAMRVLVVWQFLEAEPEGNSIHLFDGNPRQSASSAAGVPVATFRFPRQRKEDGLALSDLVLPASIAGAAGRDHIALFVTTAGEGIREIAEEAKQAGEYVRSYALQALALETAEAAAEWLHARLRTEWGFPDPPGLTRQALFQSRYRGKRYSFGYPACPDLELQTDLFRLLHPEEIGVRLTEGFMMEPEASVSALVFHHPDATYFSVGAQELAEATAD